MACETTAVPRWRERLLLLTLVVVASSGCAHQPPAVLPGVPGFFHGLLHGFLLLVSLVGSIFTDVRVYAFPNSGFLYDLGFVIGASRAQSAGGPSSSKSGMVSRRCSRSRPVSLASICLARSRVSR